MSGGGGAARGGWAWWPPSRRRQQQQTGAALERGRDWALLAAALLLLLWLLPAGSALGLSAVALGWAVWAGGTGRSSQQPQPPPRLRRAAPQPHSFSGRPAGTGAVANGGLVAMAALREKISGRPRVLLGGSPVAPPAAHFMLPPRRRYPIHQAQYASLGTLPSICWDGYRRKNRLSTCYSSPVQSPVTVKIARPDSSIGRSPLLEQPFSPGAFSPAPNSTPDPCAKEAVLNALKESRKRAMMEEEGEDETYPQGLPGGQESKRRRHGSGESGQSVLEPLVANGGLASLVPKSGSLKRGLLSHCLDDSSSKRSRTSSLSSANSLCGGGISSSIRNAIASSYSSSRGSLSQLWKRSGQSTSPLSSPASSRSQTPERPSKKTRSLDASLMEEEAQQASGTSTPVKADKEVQAEKAAETPVTRHGSLGLPSSPGSRRKRKRRIQLLPTGRVDRFFTLPPPPELGYSATSEDLDADKKATLQRFNKVLEEEADSTPDLPVETTSGPNALTFSLPAAKTLPMPSAGTAAAGSNPLLESLKKMQGKQSCPVQAAATMETPQPRTPAASLDLSSSVPVTTPEAKPLTLGLPVPLAAAPSSGPEKESASSVATTSSSELGQIPVRPLSAPRSSVLGMLVNPPVSQPSPAVTAASSGSSTAPVLKPLFGSLAKSDGPTFSSSSTPEAPASNPAPPPAAVPTLGPPCGASGSTFKPIFGEPLTPASSALPSTEATTASLFTFKQSPQLALAHRTPSSCPGSGTSGFPGLLEAASAPPASSSAPASTMPASASKPAFSFGLSVPAAPSSTNTASAAVTAATTTTTSTAQPFLFGSLPTTTAAGTPTVAPVFHFGKAAAATKPALNPGASLAFNQVPPSSTAGPAPTTVTAAATPFSIFGSGAQTPSAPPVATQQPAPLTFGSCPPAFSTAFGTPPKPPPSYRASTNQLTLDAGAPEGQQAASKPGPLNFGAHLSFTGSGAQPAAQTAFGSTTTQTAPFGGSGPLAPFGTKSSTSQPLAFGATTSVFSFGTATTSAASAPSFGATTQTTSSGIGGSLFGGSAPSSFFGAPGQPAAAAGSTFGLGAAAGGGGGTGSSTGGFSFGSGQGGAAGAAPPFGSSLAQQPSLGSQNQGSPFAFSVPGTTPEGKPAFGGAPTPTFGQSLPAPGGGTAGSTLSFGVPIAPAFGGAGATFGSTTPTFSIGAGSKMGSRQRLQARRHNTRKK